jgi:hypothetical protein
MPTTSNDIGDAFESHVASRLAGKRVGGSGSGRWLKLDVSDKFKLIVSCKASQSLKDTALRAIAKLWREAERGAMRHGGHGDGARPAMAFEVDGEALLLIRLDDWVEMAMGDAEPYITPSKAEQRRANANRSFLG